MNSCHVYKNEGSYARETAVQLENIVRYMKIHLGAVFEEFIGDFIKDEAGTWWLVNVKGYLLKPESP